MIRRDFLKATGIAPLALPFLPKPNQTEKVSVAKTPIEHKFYSTGSFALNEALGGGLRPGIHVLRGSDKNILSILRHFTLYNSVFPFVDHLAFWEARHQLTNGLIIFDLKEMYMRGLDKLTLNCLVMKITETEVFKNCAIIIPCNAESPMYVAGLGLVASTVIRVEKYELVLENFKSVGHGVVDIAKNHHSNFFGKLEI